MNLERFALPVKKLKGTDPVETLDLSLNSLGVVSAVVIASLIGVNGGLTSIDLSGNRLCGIWTDSWDSQQGTYTAEGITAIADAMRMNGALTSVELRGNKLGDEGWGAIFAAICGSKDSKIMSLDASSENIGPAGVKLIAEALRTSVTGALMVANLLGNQLDAESAKMLAEVAKQKGISLCGIQRDQTTADFCKKGLGPRDVILLGSDLSQAVVTGALASVDLSGNHLTHYGRDMTGIKELAAALGVNGSLTALNLSSNRLKDEGVSAVCEAIQSNKETKLALLNIENNGIGPVGGNAVAAMVAVTGAQTSVDVGWNDITGDAAQELATVVLSMPTLEIFCNIPIKKLRADSLSELDLSGKGVGLPGMLVLANLLPITGALTTVWTSAHDSLSLLKASSTEHSVCPRPRSSISQKTGLAGIMKMMATTAMGM